MIPPAQLGSAGILEFRKLHESGCFVVPNPWDVGTARFLHHCGFKALATTSAGFAFSQGLPDTMKTISRDMMLRHILEIVVATPLPVTADFQNGFSDTPEGVEKNVGLCVSLGVAGLSIEDATEDPRSPLYDLQQAIERVHAAKSAIESVGVPAVLTARCEARRLNSPMPLEKIIERLQAFSKAGADCLYVPNLGGVGEIEAIVKALSPKPVNVLVTASESGMTVNSLSALGVRRISTGSGLARIAWKAFEAAAGEIVERGTFKSLGTATPYSMLNGFFEKEQSMRAGLN